MNMTKLRKTCLVALLAVTASLAIGIPTTPVVCGAYNMGCKDDPGLCGLGGPNFGYSAVASWACDGVYTVPGSYSCNIDLNGGCCWGHNPPSCPPTTCPCPPSEH